MSSEAGGTLESAACIGGSLFAPVRSLLLGESSHPRGPQAYDFPFQPPYVVC